MKYSFKPICVTVAFAAVTFFTSCKKDASINTNEAAAIQAAVIQNQAIVLTASNNSGGDSIYAVNTCGQNSKRDTIAFSNLPAAVTIFLSANYPAFTAQKAFSIKDASGTLQGYVAIIQYNGNPVALKFDASGTFIQVLEQREGHDLVGHGYHRGGSFEHRDGMQRDTIALASLPAAITAYFTLSFAPDTLIKASHTRDNGYIVLSKNNGLFATIFNTSGVFVNRIDLPAHKGKGNPIDQSALPATVLNYLTTSYPAYVFNKAFQLSINGAVQGYCVIIQANSTRYGVQFDAAGNFVKVKTIN